MPGTTNPATPITSFTFTEMARMPGAIVGGRPAPASGGATFADVSGSFSTTEAIRPAIDDVFDLGVAAGDRAGRQATPPASRRRGVSMVPTGSALAATAT